jgi:hypothetical protein
MNLSKIDLTEEDKQECYFYKMKIDYEKTKEDNQKLIEENENYKKEITELNFENKTLTKELNELLGKICNYTITETIKHSPLQENLEIDYDYTKRIIVGQISNFIKLKHLKINLKMNECECIYYSNKTVETIDLSLNLEKMHIKTNNTYEYVFIMYIHLHTCPNLKTINIIFNNTCLTEENKEEFKLNFDNYLRTCDFINDDNKKDKKDIKDRKICVNIKNNLNKNLYEFDFSKMKLHKVLGNLACNGYVFETNIY